MAKYSFPVGEAAESIATALSLLSDRPIRKDQVVVEPTPQAGQYMITVYESTEFVDRVIPYIDDPIPTSMGELCLVGYKTNRAPCRMRLGQHGQIIGATESGKSSLMHVMLAHATRCPDCVIWVGGTWKLYDFVSAWLEPYLDTGLRPPFDWVAHGHRDVCEMMAAFLRVAAHRMSLRINQRGHLPYVILVLDEVTFLITNRLVTGTVHGEELTASAMLAAIARGTAGARMYEWLATQRDTMDNLGDEGGTTAAQMGFSFVFRIRDQNTVGRVTGDYTLPTPSGTGQCWADLGPSSPILNLRVPYAQSLDPLKPRLHDGPTVNDIAWSRRDIAHELDRGSASAAGEAYAARSRVVTDGFLDYLRTPQVGRPASPTDPVVGSSDPASVSELADAELRYNRMVQNALGDGTTNGHAPAVATAVVDRSAPVGVVDLSRYQTRGDRVLAIVRASTEPLGRAEIVAELRRQGDAVSDPQTVTNILGKHTRTEPPSLGRTDDDRYYTM